MRIRVFTNYINLCKKSGIQPTIYGLKVFHEIERSNF